MVDVPKLGWQCKEVWSHGAPIHQFPEWLSGKLILGTTLVAVECDGGVVLGADTRTSAGVYIPNRVSDKITRITDHIYVMRSGSVADTQAVTDIVQAEIRLYTIQTGKPVTVDLAASLFQDICYRYRDQLSAGIILAGWDEFNGGQVYSIPLGGMKVHQPVTIGGSGSTFLYGFMDSSYKPGMTRDECIKFVETAVALAIKRDGSSGGCIRTVSIDKDGAVKGLIEGDKVPDFGQF